jgi:diacylglycerol O-acyltransferase
MEQLKGIESLWLHLESPDTPRHVSSVTIYERPAAAPPISFETILRHFRERAHRSGIFRRRVVETPGAVGRPYWIEDAQFDLEYHVRHLALPRPGDWQQLCAQVARLHARPLDRKRPLWECYLIEELDKIPGLAPGSFALFIKTHYAALGGALGTQLFAALHELAPDSRSSPPKSAPYFDRAPAPMQLLLRSAADTLKTPMALLRYGALHAQPLLSWGSTQLGAFTRRKSAAGHGDESARLHAPRTRFNSPVTAHRVVEGVRFELAEVERLRDRVPAAAVLDVALTVIGGGLRRYLDSHVELPTTSLVAEVPTISRSAMPVYASRTLAEAAIMSLHTDTESERERLLRIVEDTRPRRADVEKYLGRRLMLDAVEFVPDALLGVTIDMVQRARLFGRLGPLVNTTVGSVRGPDAPLYLAGARLVAYFGLPALSEMSGLAHLVGYYHGSLTIGVTACRSMMPDPARYALCLQQAYRSLVDELGIAASGGRPKAPKIKKIVREPRMRSRRAQQRARSRPATR